VICNIEVGLFSSDDRPPALEKFRAVSRRGILRILHILCIWRQIHGISAGKQGRPTNAFCLSSRRVAGAAAHPFLIGRRVEQRLFLW
jgi:hypothetical protein